MANRIAYSVATTLQTPWHGMYRTLKAYGGLIPILTTDEVTGNSVNLFRVPAGFTITDLLVDFGTGLDSNGTKTLTAELGDATVAGRILATTTAANAVGVNQSLAVGAAGFRFPVDTDIVLTFPVGAATAVAASIAVYLMGYVDA